MKIRIIAILSLSILLNSCVSAKKYKELESRNASLQRENRAMNDDLNDFSENNKRLTTDLDKLREEHESLTAERNDLFQKLEALKKNYASLESSYDALEANSSAAIAENSRQNRELLAQLDEKEAALLQEQNRLEKLEKDLRSRSQRVDELERVIAEKDAKMNALKDAVSNALTNFEGKGLTVEQRNGKVYVSMENKLLFDSGSWAVNAEGRKAVKQLGQVLAENPDIAVLIEGHTDNVPYNGSGQLKDNWDLSTKRATSIVQILRENSGIDPQNLTAAGRGEFAPVATNETAQGKAKNRRIEVILTPKLDEITKLLQESN
ncbi:OmpA/MotB family protein [Christiangramia flava]|uniref:Flagellar motor rotation protein MotB n=1 Tax=Christiangramia flava JLT2011 TaxID=1229726 RepID=A0A1L7I484_9FLAO|nr:OmpA family protein [Christiangramia flava]APU68420.1 Flagellar motor rotation protein MotB [Christiangramia flava JLT2011]OSS40792.1 Flagellar motor rotation protein MotB [Christiangramia flava JLT2011]